MAGDWIPYETTLPTKGETQRIARAVGVSRFEVCGRLMAFWGWASTETASGLLRGIDIADLVDVVGFDHVFWEAVVAVGWLSRRSGGLFIPNAERWITRAAKARLQKNRRQQKWRDGPVDAPVDAPSVSKASTTEQNSTVQNRSLSSKESRFVEFWERWPPRRRVEKKKAAAAFARLGAEDREAAIAGAARYRDDTAMAEPRFLLHPHRWIERRRWEDEAPALVGPSPAVEAGLDLEERYLRRREAHANGGSSQAREQAPARLRGPEVDRGEAGDLRGGTGTLPLRTGPGDRGPVRQ